jgi:DNA-binding HxlR family transcriptional regulator
MLGRTYEAQDCSVARALEVVGERWSLLIIRDALFAGSTRFRDFQQALGVASNVLSARLEGFVRAGLMERRPAEGHDAYVLTAKGRDLQPVVMALADWGDKWAAPYGPPVAFEHAGCGGGARQETYCAVCAEDLGPGDVVAVRRAGSGTAGPAGRRAAE